MNLLQAMDDPKLFGPWFGGSKAKHWKAWRAVIAAIFALPMSADQLAIYRECTQRINPPTKRLKESWWVIGRRGGKSRILAAIAVFLACFCNYTKHLAPGERGTILIIAADKKQARVILRYVRGLLHGVPMLKSMVQRETAEAFDLNTRVTIEIGVASYKRTRGYTLVAALCDEIAFWPVDEEAAEPDKLVLEALRPGMATIPNSMLLCASSPYAKRGAMWDAHSRHFGKEDSDVLVWQASTRTMNQTVPQSLIDRAMEDDPASASCEFLAHFRNDLAAYVSRNVVEAAIVHGRFENPPLSGIQYIGFADAAGGSGKDSFTAAVCHLDRATKRIVIDAIREKRPPFGPESTCEEMAHFFKSYRVHRITLDRWAGDFPSEQFRKHGLTPMACEKPKSDLYKEFLPLLNSGMVELLDQPRLIKQLLGLERRMTRGGPEKIDHAPGRSDDAINSCAGVAVMASAKGQPLIITQAAIQKMSRPSANRPVLMSSWYEPKWPR